jgi:DNA-binding LytR/AlgR family response regulator
MNCIIIDDDKLSRKVIEEFIERTESTSLVASFESAIDAINSIKVSPVEIDLVFLDIEMPEMTGIEFLNTFKDHPQVIIVSAKEKYALEAFEYDVTDYLLKPISYARFYKAVTKAQSVHSDKKQMVSASFDEGNNEIFIKRGSRIVRLNYNDILFVEALENYVIVTTYIEKYTIHFTMKSIITKLPLKLFKRVHRSFIVNITQIKGIEDNSVIVKLEEGTKVIPIGKSYKEKLMKEINLITKD